MRQLEHYHEALKTIHDVTEMSSDDVVENADFAFMSPELTLRDGDWHKERALMVGLTLRALGKAFERLPHPPMTREEISWLARAAAVFSRRFEALGSLKEMTPDFSPAAARDTLTRILPEVASPHVTLLVSSALGRTESTHRYGNFAHGLRSPDSLISSMHWMALAEAFPQLIDHRPLLRRKITFTKEGKQLFITREISRWLDENHPQWYHPERVLSELKLLHNTIEYFQENGLEFNHSELTDFIREIQQVVLTTLSYRASSKREHRRRIEALYFQLEEFIPEFRQIR